MLRRFEVRDPGLVVFTITARRAMRSAALWGVVLGLVNVGSVSGYASAYPTAADREHLAESFASNVGLAALLGIPHRLDTVGGFVAWRAVGFLAIVGAIWGLLTSTRLLRGEEDAGRWQLLLSGHTTRGRAAGHALLGLAAGLASMWTVSAGLSVAAGRVARTGFPTGAALYLAAVMTGGAALFAGVGAVAAQLAPSRRYANVLGGGVLGLSFLVRMVADSNPDRGWLRWATPLGWVENLRPLTGSNALAFLPVVGLVVLLAGAVVVLAASRDVDGSVLRSQAPRSRPVLLNGPTALAARLAALVGVGWSMGLAAIGIVAGMVGQDATRAYRGSEPVERFVSRLGGSTGGAFVVGVIFLAAAALLSLCAAGQVTAMRDDEASGMVDHLLARSVRRWRWLAGRLAVGSVLVVSASLAMAVGAWVGAAGTGDSIGLARLLESGVSVVPPALLVLSAGTLAFSVAPRRTAVVVYGLVLWSVAIEFVAAAVKANRLLLDTSLLHHVAPAPAADPDWLAAGVITALSSVAACAALTIFSRRDLAPA